MSTRLSELHPELTREILTASRCELWDKQIDVSGMTLSGGVVAPHGTKLTPDKFRAYVEFRLAHAFPVISSYNTSFHPSTIKNSFMSMLNQQFNYGHKVSSYYKDKPDEDVREDRILGSIIAIEYPREPMGGWTLTNEEDSPGIRCVATVAKQAKGMDKVFGQHSSGRHDWTVSLELEYMLVDSGVVLIPEQRGDLGGRRREEAITEEEQAILAKYTPPDYAKAGLSYLPLVEGPESLIDCFNRDKGVWDKPWKGNRIITMMGGIQGSVDFKGTGLVKFGAEPSARIEQILAEDKEMAAFSEGVQRLSIALDMLVGN